MTELLEAEDRLQIALPQTYVEAVEDFGVSDTDAWRLYRPNDLVWFRHHQLSKSVSIKHEALVVGESADGEALLVMLGYEVAGIPTLSDELYRLDDDGVNAEPVALDLLHLLEDGRALAIGEKETLHETAFVARARTPKVVDALTEALGGRGYTEPPADFDPDGEYLEVFVSEATPALVVVRNGDLLWLGRRMATLLDTSVSAYAVSLDDEMVETSNGDWEFPVRTRVVDITKDGQMVDRESWLDGETANYGDAHETVRGVLHDLMERSLGRGLVLDFHRPKPDDISPRVASLLGLVAEAAKVGVTEVAGQQAIRIELADGSVQMSVVNDEELATLRERAGF